MPAYATRARETLPTMSARLALQVVPGPAGIDGAASLPAEAAALVAKLMPLKRKVRCGEYLLRSGSAFQHVYVVRTGMFKSTLLDAEGREQVIGFQMAGEVLGMDGIEREVCPSNSVALEDSEVWELPYGRLETACRQEPAIQRLFHRLMSREIQRDCHMMLLLGSMNAEERLAAFLINLSQRLLARGYSATRFVLRMSRREIGSYLGLTLETVSRVFSRFQREGLIRAELKAVELKSVERLCALVGTSVRRAA